LCHDIFRILLQSYGTFFIASARKTLQKTLQFHLEGKIARSIAFLDLAESNKKLIFAPTKQHNYEEFSSTPAFTAICNCLYTPPLLSRYERGEGS
jgi:hypothetical protein